VGNELLCSLVKQWRAKIRKEGHNGILGSINMHPLNLFDGLNFILLYSMVYIMIFHLKKSNDVITYSLCDKIYTIRSCFLFSRI
jgi:hypothetical protein